MNGRRSPLIKADRELKELPTVILTTSGMERFSIIVITNRGNQEVACYIILPQQRAVMGPLLRSEVLHFIAANLADGWADPRTAIPEDAASQRHQGRVPTTSLPQCDLNSVWLALRRSSA